MNFTPLDFIKYCREAHLDILYNGRNSLIDRAVFTYLSDQIDFCERGQFIGERVRFTNASIAANISERDGQGVRSLPKVFKASDVRNAINRLIKLGLFERVSIKSGSGQLLLCAKIGGHVV